MLRPTLTLLAVTLTALIHSSCSPRADSIAAPATPAPEWVELFNGENLDGWIARLGKRGNETSQTIEDIFRVRDGVIQVYAGAAPDSFQYNGNLYTEKSFSNYHLQVEYRWEENRFRPRHRAVRDAGILFHIHTAPDDVWPPSVEMQLGGGKPGAAYVTGDLWVIGNTRVKAPSIEGRYQIGAPLVEFGFGDEFLPVNLTSIAATKPHGEWNLAEVIVHGSESAEFILNGQHVGSVSDMRFQDEAGEWQPLTSGPISIQAEWAELEYRAVRIKEL